MKLAIAALLLGVVGMNANASPLSDAMQSVRETFSFNTGSSFSNPIEVKGRTGSTRRGGYNSKGKGSHYTGGRR